MHFKDISNLLVPQYLLITVISPLAAFIVFSGSFPNLDMYLAMAAYTFVIFGFNSINMIYDEKIDSINKPNRPIVSGRITKNEAYAVALFFHTAALTTAYLISVKIVILIIALQIATLLYTHPSTYFKKYFWSSSLFGAFFYAIIPTIIALSIANVELKQYFYLIFISLLYAIIANSKDIEDTKGEAKFGINSIPIIFGREATTLLIIFSVIILLIISLMLAMFNNIEQMYLSPILFSLLFSIPFSFLLLKTLKKKKQDIPITQSKVVNFCMIFAVITQLLFAFFAIKYV